MTYAEVTRSLLSRPVAVVGLGQIGMSWCAYFLARGLSVRGFDPSPAARKRTQEYIDNAWPRLERMELVVPSADRRMRFADTLADAVADCGLIQENGPEDEKLKRALLCEIEAAAPETALIASSTSAIPMSLLQRDCRLPGRCLTAHPFNPPHLVPLVELVGGEQTDPTALEQARAFYLAIGREPIVLRQEVYGHVANRLQYVLFNEAARLVLDGVATVEDVDKAITWGPGLRWPFIGPFMTFHMAGGGGGMLQAFAKFAKRDAASTDRATRLKLAESQQRQLHDAACEAQKNLTVQELECRRDELLLRLYLAKMAVLNTPFES